ncbi:MAG TPA: TrpB-like pyridoxal phosphate-dependent enzyme [Thermoanaerobaculaceae bacterium]|mgnify:CR=1 FL=1|nr:TrpB-like pyridoxal phosphate-dependent enzyme [Thermoanaerobaculaceae bacterium]HPS78542.1 TrpB-like pyridoxal phosphate-dependent enzyme [Thermoanaerobaculaceae bacterium]
MASTNLETTTRSMLSTTAATDRITLPASELPECWYNVLADMPIPMAPPIHPGTGAPVGPQDLERLFAPQLIEQEMSSQREIPIPEAVREILSMWRPTPLIRARNLERALGTPARIYFKNEGVSPAGSHKPNTAVPQAYYNAVNGVMRLSTETGAGQWGSALAFATRMLGMACRVYMVRVSYEQKPYRRTFMRLFGAEVFPSPSPLTQAGRDILAEHPNSPGSLGIAISEAVEEAASRDDTNYSLGSVLNHVLLHQTVIGQEARKQLDLVGEEPDFVYGCHGGGSNFGGITLPFMPEVFAGGKVRTVAVEPESCPTLTRGRFAFDYGDTAKLTPILQMYTLGHDFVPPAVHAGGLRYHGASPIVSALVHQGAMEAESVGQRDVFKAAVLFAHTEGIVPAPESSHAIAAVVRKALELKEEGREAVILFSLSGHGFFDMGAYDAYLDGKLEDFEYPEHAIEESLARLPQVG